MSKTCKTGCSKSPFAGDKLISSSSGITYCGLTGIGTSTPGITFVTGVPGWYYYAVAVW